MKFEIGEIIRYENGLYKILDISGNYITLNDNIAGHNFEVKYYEINKVITSIKILETLGFVKNENDIYSFNNINIKESFWFKSEDLNDIHILFMLVPTEIDNLKNIKSSLNIISFNYIYQLQEFCKSKDININFDLILGAL